MSEKRNTKTSNVLFKNHIKPKSQKKDVDPNDKGEDKYVSKKPNLLKNTGIKLKKRVAPGLSKIIIRKNSIKFFITHFGNESFIITNSFFCQIYFIFTHFINYFF